MRKIRNYLLTLIVLLNVLHVDVTSQTAHSPAKIIEQYKMLIKEHMKKSRLVGVGAALILGDSVVWKQGFGYEDKEKNIPFTTQSTQSIGSITKPFTVLGIMQMQEKGLIDIHQPLVNYLPQFRIKTRGADLKQITVKSLIDHTSGLPNDILLNATDKNERYTDTLKYLKKEYLAYPPGMVYHYSNLGYCLLGHTIFAVSKQGYPDYLQAHVLKPAGMKDSGFPAYNKLHHVSKTYDKNGNIVARLPMRNIPSGALHSNIDDMVSFAQELIAIYHGKKQSFITPQTLKKVFSEQNFATKIKSRKNGLGWSILKNKSAFAVLHFGSNNVEDAMLVILPGKKMAAVMLVNTAGGGQLTGQACSKLLEAFGLSHLDHITKHTGTPRKTEVIKLSADAQAKHQGSYAHTRTIIKITRENGDLTLKANFGTFLLKPVSPDEFIPVKVIGPGKHQEKPNARFIFKDIEGHHVLFWETPARMREPLAYKLSPQNINQTWKRRMGKYEVSGYKLEGQETFSKVELSFSKNQSSGIPTVQLKIYYTSGEYKYILRIENENQLVFCGFDDQTGGETIQFKRGKLREEMFLKGLTLIKVE